MRFSTILAASTMALLSIASAQSTAPDPAVVAACNACIATAGAAAVPACKGLENVKNANPDAPTDQQRACWCGLTTNKAWATQCVESKKCPVEAVESLSKLYENFAAKHGACDKVFASASASASAPTTSSTSTSAAASSRFCGSSSVKVAAAAGAALAMAMAGALL